MCVRFDEENVRCMGRAARGVRGITLVGDDVVMGVAVVDESKTLLTVTENGLGKRTEFSDFREMKHRGGKGVTCHKITEKSGKLAAIQTVSEDDDIMVITNTGTIIRMSVSDINVYSRTAAGVIVMRLAEGQSVVNFTKVAHEDEEAAEGEAPVEAPVTEAPVADNGTEATE
jgi:DNA gyrase subunit A